MLTDETLKMKQDLPLEVKIKMTEARIREFYTTLNGKCYISFSGGKDSTVLLHIARKLYPDIKAVFLDTGLEYPEIKDFVKTIDNVITLIPKQPFNIILKKWGYPIVSKDVSAMIYQFRNSKNTALRNKRLNGFGDKKVGKIPEKWFFLTRLSIKISSYCCNVLKKHPAKSFEIKTGMSPIIGTMASESNLRKQAYLKNGGCNSFNGRVCSNPLSFWLEDDIWEYIKLFNVSYSDIYKKGYSRTGCMFCTFGLNKEERPDRFDKMKEIHPQYFNYCMDNLGLRDVIKQIYKREY